MEKNLVEAGPVQVRLVEAGLAELGPAEKNLVEEDLTAAVWIGGSSRELMRAHHVFLHLAPLRENESLEGNAMSVLLWYS